MMAMQTEELNGGYKGDKPFSIEVEHRPEAVVVWLAGSCTMTVAAQLGERLVQLASEPAPLIVVDMAGLDFIESTGLGGLVAGYLRSRRYRNEVRLVSLQPSIHHLFELTRLTQLFRVFDTLDDALAAEPIGP